MQTYKKGTGVFSPQEAEYSRDVALASELKQVSEVINIAASANVKDAAGVTIAISLSKAPIYEKNSSKVGSFWGKLKNRLLKEKGQSLVETNGSAAFTVFSATDLESIFESSGFGRYVAKVTDSAGAVLYGWIGGVAVSGNVYTFSVYDGFALGTQNWFQGGSTGFNANLGFTVEIYKYTTSLSFGSSDTFTEEVPLSNVSDDLQGSNEFKIFAELENGQYAVDYLNGIIYAKKADNDDTETVTYTTRGLVYGATNSVASVTEDDNDLIVKAAPGLLHKVFVSIDEGQATDVYYLQFFDSATAPADATATSSSVFKAVPINHTNGTPTNVSIDFGGTPQYFSAGIYVCLSTTEYTKTIAGSVAGISAIYT